MIIKTVAAGLLVTVVLGAIPGAAVAQPAGLQAGIAQRPAAPQSTFRFVPAYVWPAPPPAPVIALVPNFPTVIVPNTVLVPGQTFIPGPFVNPAPIVVAPPSVFYPVVPPPNALYPVVASQNVLYPNVPVVAPLRRLPPMGTPRGEVLRLLGQPSVTVITSTGETLDRKSVV